MNEQPIITNSSSGDKEYLDALKRIQMFKAKATACNSDLPVIYNSNQQQHKHKQKLKRIVSSSSSSRNNAPIPSDRQQHVFKDKYLNEQYSLITYLIKKERTLNRSTLLPPITSSSYQKLLKKPFNTIIPHHQQQQHKPPSYKLKPLSIPNKPLPITNYYYYKISPGNNSSLIERVMQTRHPQWQSITKSKHAHIPSFVWTAQPYGVDFTTAHQLRQIVNHIEFNTEIGNKMKLISNLILHDKTLFTYVPFTIVFPINNETMFNKNLQSFKTFFNELPTLITKHKTFNYSDYFTYPTLSNNVVSKINVTLQSSLYKGSNLWLIKPINLSRGRCIYLYNTVQQIETKLNDIKHKKQLYNEENEPIRDCEYVMLQKCVERTQLYRNKKTDFRVWLLITYYTTARYFIFKEGHFRSCSVPYDANSTNEYVHLTNYSVQKHHKDFGKDDEGNEMSFKKVESECKKVNIRKDVWPKIKSVVGKGVAACKEKINKFNRKRCFEIFGCDLIADDMWNVFLVEINTNPGLDESSGVIRELLPRMIDDAFKLCVDEIKGERGRDGKEGEGVFKVKGYDDKENMWEELDGI